MKTTKHIIFGLAGLVLVLMTGLVMAEKPDTKELSRAILKIDSLSCGGCFSTINAGLTPLEGYSGMGANLFRKLIAIDFTAPLTAQKISRTLSDMGYLGELETVDAISQKESFTYLESKRTGFTSGGGSCCSPGRSNGSNTGNRNSSDLTPAPSGSCCAVPGVFKPTQNL